ncbi:hypothetical protein QBC33DRAFT_610954 [Phialemonium atrogriseum]|uniref:Uncharacterized protein n=1 Tax=Phialemonium atrogriseum TaxID=1093897 RepID=A0AAJ0FP73_9PEZI|nr:uncharacterized protein QBC33DRAFT_610954 [Phialemonium atrogriseum]KAK1767880.1 hypothetical protein QBC33DRAFT_610954 [Phialemonium atrogriseum]
MAQNNQQLPNFNNPAPRSSNQGGIQQSQQLLAIIEHQAYQIQQQDQQIQEIIHNIQAINAREIATEARAKNETVKAANQSQLDFALNYQNQLDFPLGAELLPLHDLRTGAVIPGCPRNYQDFCELRESVADQILTALQLPVEKGLDDKLSKIYHELF